MKRVFAKRHRSHSPFRQSDSSDRLLRGCFSPETTFMSSLPELLPDRINQSNKELQDLEITKAY
jgi:hypothetical protein